MKIDYQYNLLTEKIQISTFLFYVLIVLLMKVVI